MGRHTVDPKQRPSRPDQTHSADSHVPADPVDHTEIRIRTSNRRATVSALAALVAFPPLDACGQARSADKIFLTGSNIPVTVHAQPRRLPKLAMRSVAGAALSADAFIGNPVILNLWATWCGPCVNELPSLDKLSSAIRSSGINVALLSQDAGASELVMPFLARLKVRPENVYLDSRAAAMESLRVRLLPTTIFVDSSGREVARLAGAAKWDSPESIAIIKTLLKPSGSPDVPTANAEGKAR